MFWREGKDVPTLMTLRFIGGEQGPFGYFTDPGPTRMDPPNRARRVPNLRRAAHPIVPLTLPKSGSQGVSEHGA